MRAISYGAGNNSKAMVVELVRRREPIDLITMADPGSEYPHTYADAWDVSTWLEAQGYPSITVVRNDGIHPTLEGKCLAQQTLPSIVYGYKSCSHRYKIEVQDKYVASLSAAQALWVRGEKVERCIGYHALEPERAGIPEDRRYRYRYPLIEWRMGPRECIEAILRAGLRVPGKSSCTFCPSTPAVYVLKLKREHPELFARALAMEANAMPTLRTVKGLGRRWSWAALSAADDAQGDMFGFPDPPALPCACHDGEEDDEPYPA